VLLSVYQSMLAKHCWASLRPFLLSSHTEHHWLAMCDGLPASCTVVQLACS
jgi:hypothetical protein